MSAGEQADRQDSWTWLARVRRTQGRKGEVFSDVLTDFPEKFNERRRLWLLRDSLRPETGRGSANAGATGHPAAREVELVHHWPHKGGMVLHFAGVDSISAAEELVGMVVAIPQGERAELDAGDVYVGDLEGCELWDVAGAEPVLVGRVAEVDRSMGPVAMLVLAGAKGEVLIPFAKSYLRRVDVEQKRVEMALPEGLADLNA